MIQIRFWVALVLSCFNVGFAARSLVGLPPLRQPPVVTSRTWFFPENETNSNFSRLTRNLEPCEIRKPQGVLPTNGFCLKLTECPPLLANIRNRRERPTVCYYEGAEPVICCPNIVKDLPKKLPSRNLVVAGCGIRPVTAPIRRVARSSGSPLIAGGNDAVPFSWPWMVAVFRKSGNTYRYHCGAALISKSYILSAAHCFAGGGRTNNPDLYAVRLGVHRRKNGTLYGLTSIQIHEQYNVRRHYNDIAILKLNTDLPIETNTVPVCLPPKNSNQPSGTGVVVTGWGDTSFGGRDSETLREVGLLVFSNGECNESYYKIASASFPQGVTNNMICAGQRNGGKDACQGDSGGPMVHHNGDTWSLLGLVSFGYGCAQVGFPGIYTRVSSYIDWIASKTNSLDRMTQN